MKPLRLFYFLAINLIILSCNKPSATLVDVKILNDYPSASAVCNFKGRIYLAGDDATNILVLDTGLNQVDSIHLFFSDGKRIPKAIKADIESITVVRGNKKPFLLLLGSGSLAPYRNSCWLIDLVSKEKTAFHLDSFYHRIRDAGIRELNIEGVATLPGVIVLANRGNKSFPRNHLIFTTQDFWNDPDSADIHLVKIGTNSDTAVFNGISGLDYSFESDQLLLTVSTEHTNNNFDDGSIGKSYLWIINDINSRKRFTAINPDRIIELEGLDSRFKGHKIESVTILKENNNEMELLLASDDDKGGSALFRVILNKQE